MEQNARLQRGGQGGGLGALPWVGPVPRVGSTQRSRGPYPTGHVWQRLRLRRRRRGGQGSRSGGAVLRLNAGVSAPLRRIRISELLLVLLLLVLGLWRRLLAMPAMLWGRRRCPLKIETASRAVCGGALERDSVMLWLLLLLLLPRLRRRLLGERERVLMQRSPALSRRGALAARVGSRRALVAERRALHC